MKLEIPATVSTPVSVIAPVELTFNDPVVVKLTPKSTPPVPAFTVRFPSPVEAIAEKLTALPVPVAFNIIGVLSEFNPANEIVPLLLFPTIIFAAVIRLSSVLDNEKSPAPEPNPIVLPVFAASNVVSAVPDEIELSEPKATSLAVMDKELLLVIND